MMFDTLRLSIHTIGGNIDWTYIISVGVLVIVALLVAACMFCDTKGSVQLNDFLDRYEPDQATVIRYLFTPAQTRITLAPTMVGKTMSPIAYPARDSGWYGIEVECQNKGKHFSVIYEIPEKEYQQYPVGTVVSIEPHWKRKSCEQK